jgi:hypothetical protein
MVAPTGARVVSQWRSPHIPLPHFLVFQSRGLLLLFPPASNSTVTQPRSLQRYSTQPHHAHTIPPTLHLPVNPNRQTPVSDNASHPQQPHLPLAINNCGDTVTMALSSMKRNSSTSSNSSIHSSASSSANIRASTYAVRSTTGALSGFQYTTGAFGVQWWA